MRGKFGTRSCSYCGREFQPIRGDQHLCKRECHDAWFVEERRRALALWRKYRNHVVVEDGDAEVA
jgi:hypothetical protein